MSRLFSLCFWYLSCKGFNPILSCIFIMFVQLYIISTVFFFCVGGGGGGGVGSSFVVLNCLLLFFFIFNVLGLFYDQYCFVLQLFFQFVASIPSCFCYCFYWSYCFVKFRFIFLFLLHWFPLNIICFHLSFLKCCLLSFFDHPSHPHNCFTHIIITSSSSSSSSSSSLLSWSRRDMSST